MPVNLTRLNIKLNAIQSKNKQEIVSKQVYLPFKGTSYDSASLTSWLQDRADITTASNETSYLKLIEFP